MSQTLVVKLNVKNLKTAGDLREAVSAIPGFTISSNGTLQCDVLFLEIGYDIDEEFKLIEQIRAQGAAREIFLASSRKDPDILLRAMKTGVKEFFPLPLNKEELVACLSKFKRKTEAELRAKAKEKNGFVISVIGSKGGVGATTLAVNLAVSVKEAGGTGSVALMDMNPLLGGVPLFLDIKTSFSWAEGARDISRMDSTYLLSSLYKHPSGIHVLPAPSRPSGLEAATPETMDRLMGMMRSAFDIIIMDGCRSFDDLSLRMLALSDTILVISELNLPSVINAKKLMDTFEGLGLSYGKDIKVVINRYQKKNMISPEEAEKTLGKKIACLIPNDYEATMSAINTGKTLADAGQSAVTDKFKELAALLLNKETVKKEKSAFFQVMKNFREIAFQVHKGSRV